MFCFVFKSHQYTWPKTQKNYSLQKNESKICWELLYIIFVDFKVKATKVISLLSIGVLNETWRVVDRFLTTRVMMVKWPMSGHVESSSSF